MTKTILVPVDFTIESLNTLKLALKEIDATVDVILLHSEILTDSITELIFYSPEKIIESVNTPTFESGLQILKNKYEYTLGSVSIKLFHGNNSPSLHNFLAANKVSEIYLPATYELKLSARSFNPVSLLKRSGLPVHYLSWNKLAATETDQLDALFNN